MKLSFGQGLALGALIGGILGAPIYGAIFDRTRTPTTKTEKPAPVTTPSALERALQAQAENRVDWDIQKELGLIHAEVDYIPSHDFLSTVYSDGELRKALTDLQKAKITVYVQRGSLDPDNGYIAGGYVDQSGKIVCLFANASPARLRQFLLGHQ